MVSRERRVLYDLTVHAELSARCRNEPLLSTPSYCERFFRWGPNLQRAGGLLGYFSLPPALLEHTKLRPAYSLHASPDGEHVAILTREGLFVRSREAGFDGNDTEATWPLPAGADGRYCLHSSRMCPLWQSYCQSFYAPFDLESSCVEGSWKKSRFSCHSLRRPSNREWLVSRAGEWQVAWEARGEVVAVGTTYGQLYVVERTGKVRCSRAAPTGLAGVVFCGSTEVLCVTYEGKLYRLSVRSADAGSALPEASASLLETAGGGVDGVVGCISIDAARHVLYVGGATRGLPSLTRWRTPPGAEIAPMPSRFNRAEELPSPNPAFTTMRDAGQPALHACCQLRVSPSGRFVAAADTGGRAIVWPADGGTAPVACANADSVTDLAWWGDEALAMVQRVGAVTIDALADGANLLGDPEVFNPFSALCSVSDGAEQHQLMVLEGPETEDRLEGSGIGTLALCLVQQTTPEQKFAVQLQNKEYGSALQLAQYYGLSTDEVYKAQWLDAPVSRESNADYLSKVQESGWALEQCLQRAVNTGKEARCLLDHGLTLTSLPLLRQQVEAAGATALDAGLSSASDGMEPEPEAERLSALTPEEIRLCEVRAELVRRRNRLSTHIEIQRGYNRDVFLRFRDATLLDEAKEFALQGNIDGVELLLTHHGNEDDGSLLAQRLTLLNSLPETAKPKSYAKLLPALDGDTVRDLVLQQWHDDDYVDSAAARLLWCPEKVGPLKEGVLEGRVSQMPGVTVADVAAWYTRRALEIDERSGQIYVCQELLREGIKNGIPGLELLDQTVKELIDIVERGTGSVDMTIPQYQRLTPEHRLSCFIGDCTEATIADAVFSQAQGLLQSNPGLLEEFLLSKAPENFQIPAAVLLHGSAPQSKGELVKTGMLRDENEYIRTVLECIYSCEQTNIWELLWKVWESVAVRNKGMACSDLSYRTLHCMIDKLEGRLEAAQITSSVYNMHYAVSFFGNVDDQATLQDVKSGQWKNVQQRCTSRTMAAKFQCFQLPASVELQILGDTRLKKSQDKVRLVCRRWRLHAAKLRSIHQVLRSLPRSVPPPTTQAGSAGLKMVQHVQFFHDIFCCVPYEDALLYSLEGLLVRGYYTTAQQLIDGTLPTIEGLRPIEALYDSESESLDPLVAKRIGHVALNAARELVNGCNDLRGCSSDCKAAQACLTVIGDMHDHFSRGFLDKLEAEQNFIGGLQRVSAFDMRSFKLPLQVRQCEDKMLILREILEGQEVYSNVKSMVELFDMLGFGTKEDRLRVQAEMTQFAFQTGDVRFACDQTLLLIDAGYADAWSLGHTIGKLWNSETIEMNKPSTITSCNSAVKLLAFAVHHCPPDALAKVLSDWRKCEKLVAEHSDDGLGKLLGKVEDRIEKRAAAVAHQAEHLLTGLGGASQQVLSVFRPLHAPTAVKKQPQVEEFESEIREPMRQSQTVGVHPFYAKSIVDAVAAQIPSTKVKSLPSPTVDSVAEWVAANTFDLPLCAAVLLDLPEPQQIDEVLNRLVQNSAIQSSLQCTLGLMCFSSILIGHQDGHAGVEKLLSASEDAVGSMAVQCAEAVSSDANADVAYCAQRVVHYHDTAGDAELQNVLDLTRVDREKFFMNEQYRSDEIDRLISNGHHAECERLLNFMDIPLWHMHSQLLRQRLQGNGDDAPEEWMRDRQSLLSEPVDMEQMLREDILKNLSGAQHNRLAMSLQLLLECCTLNSRDTTETIKKHVESLQAILTTPESFRQGLDYRRLVGASQDFSGAASALYARDDAIEVLGPHISEASVAVVAKTMGSVTLHSGELIDSSLVYRSYLQHMLDACQNIDHEWHRASKYLKECDALDTLSVCQCVCRDLQKWPIAVCSRILADGIKLADAKILKVKRDVDKQAAVETLQTLKRHSAYLKGVVKLTRDGHEDWAEWLETSLDVPTIRSSLVKMAALGCPQDVLTSAAANLLALSSDQVVTEAVDAEVEQIYFGAIDLALSTFSVCDVAVQRSALVDHLFNQYRLPGQHNGGDRSNCSVVATIARQNPDYWGGLPPTALLDLILNVLCTVDTSARVAQAMCAHLISRWCPSSSLNPEQETDATVAPTLALLAVNALSSRTESTSAAEHRTLLLYSVASQLFQKVVGWCPEPGDTATLMANAAKECKARVGLLERMHELYQNLSVSAPLDWNDILHASTALVLMFSETDDQTSASEELWVFLLRAIVQHGDILSWVEPSTIACAELYRTQYRLLPLVEYQNVMALLTGRADKEWQANNGEASGRLEAVAASLGLGAGYDDQGLTDQVVARLQGLSAARLAAWPVTGPHGLEAAVMASLVEKQLVVQLATTVLWCGGAPHESKAAGRSAGLLLDYVAAAADEVWSGQLADLVINQLPVHAALLMHRRSGTHPSFCGMRSSLMRIRRLLMAVATDDWRTFAVLACSRADPAGLSDGTVAKCREASRLLTEWKQLPDDSDGMTCGVDWMGSSKPARITVQHAVV